MKEYSKTNPASNIALSTPLYKRRQNFISSPVPPNDSRTEFLRLLDGKPPYPFFKLNTDGSALDNPGLVGARGVLQDHQGQWILGFSVHVGLATNNLAELAAVR